MFKAGDKVVCVNNDGYESSFTEGKVYTVSEGDDLDSDFVWVVADHGESRACFHYRFVLASEYKSSVVADQEKPNNEPSFTIGQELLLIADTANTTKRLKQAVLLDATPSNDLYKIMVEGIECFVEAKRLFIKE